PRAHADSRIPGAHDQHHAFFRSRRAVPGFGVATPIFLHRVPRASARAAAAGRERFRRHRYAPDQGAARGPAMTATTTTDGSPPSRWRRTVAFASAIVDVLRRPSSVFSLGLLVLAGFIAGVIFWGAFNTALELTNTETFCTSCHEMRS